MKKEKILKDATILFPVRDAKVLLAIKGRHIGEGLWNGFGGGIEEGETVIESAIRELKDESGLITQAEDLEKVAVVDFHNMTEEGEKFVCRCHVFLVMDWSGELIETAEMLRPTWFRLISLPLNEMMLADRHWVPLILRGKKVVVEAHYGPFQKTLLGPVIVTEVSILPD